jgi:transposase
MITLEFSDADVAALEYERYHHPHPQVQRKMEVVYLKSQGLSHQQIRQLCRIQSRTTLATYLRQYEAGGIEALKQLHYQGQPSQLNEHVTSLKAHFEAHPPRTSAEAQAEIERLTGIKRSPTQIKAFLKRIGMQSRKVGYIPGKSASEEKMAEQEQFRINELEPRLAEAERGERAVFLLMLPISFTGLTWVLFGALPAFL